MIDRETLDHCACAILDAGMVASGKPRSGTLGDGPCNHSAACGYGDLFRHSIERCRAQARACLKAAGVEVE